MIQSPRIPAVFTGTMEPAMWPRAAATINALVRDANSRQIDTGYVDARWHGAKFDGVTDDAPAINAANVAAIALGGRTILLSGQVARIASTVQISANNSLEGANFIPGAPVGGTRLLADAGVTVALQVGDGNNNGTISLRKFTVTRAGGIPSADKIGILVAAGFNIVVEDVMSDNHGQNWLFQSDVAAGLGISTHLSNCFSSRASDAHLVADGWPEVYWQNGRFGVNGSSDYNCSTHIRIKGGVPFTAGGPNTITIVGAHFNQGFNKPDHFMEFVDLGGSIPDIDAGNVKISNCHIEGIASANFYSDSTWNAIPRLYLTNNTWNTPLIPMFDFDAALATLSEWDIVGNGIWCSTFDLAPTNGFTAVNIAGGRITGTVHLTGVAGSDMSMEGVSHGANVVVDGAWGQFTRHGCRFTAGALTVSATGNLDIDDITWAQGSWVPEVRINGSSAGITTSLAVGGFQIKGRMVMVDVEVTLSSKGGGTGPVSIHGLSFPAANAAGGGAFAASTNMAGLTGAVVAQSVAGQSYLALRQYTATGTTNLTDAELTNTSDLRFTITYPWR